MSDANSEFDPNHGADLDPDAARTEPPGRRDGRKLATDLGE